MIKEESMHEEKIAQPASSSERAIGYIGKFLSAFWLLWLNQNQSVAIMPILFFF